MNFNLYNTILAYGDYIPLRFFIDPIPVLKKIADLKWTPYNPRKKINRYGLSVTNLTGTLGPGPDLDSLFEYNKEHHTTYTELSFTKKTELYDIVKPICNPIEKWIGRSHIIKLTPGGFFPSHRDNTGLNIESFRLLVSFTDMYSKFFIFEGNKLMLDLGRMYFLNTCKEHIVFNASFQDMIFLVLNIKLCESSAEFVTINTDYD
jgi:hypothetical protein